MADDELIQAAERALYEAEAAYRAEPTEANRQRVMRAWTQVQTVRGDSTPDDVPYPRLTSRPRPRED